MLLIKLDESADNPNLKKLGEARMRITPHVDKIPMYFSRYGTTRVTFKSLKGLMKFYKPDGTLVGSELILEGAPIAHEYHIELLQEEDVLIIDNAPYLQTLGSWQGFLISPKESNRILTLLDNDFWSSFSRVRTTVLNLPLDNISGIDDIGYFVDKYPNLIELHAQSGSGGEIQNLNFKNIKESKLTTFSLGAGRKITGDINDLPSTLRSLNAVDAYNVTYSGTSNKLANLTNFRLSFGTASTLQAVNDILVMVSNATWSGSKVCSLYSLFSANDLDQNAINTLRSKGVTLTV